MATIQTNRVKSWLVQRGKIEKINNEYNTYALFDFVKLDYMGYFEYECGTLQSSLKRIIENNEIKLFKTDIQNYKNKTIYCFCRSEMLENVKAMIEYEKDGSHTMTTKGSTKIIDAFNKDCPFAKYAPNFWWDVVNDFMIFLGDDKMASAFEQAFAGSVRNNKRYKACKTAEESEQLSETIGKESRQNKDRLYNKNKSK